MKPSLRYSQRCVFKNLRPAKHKHFHFLLFPISQVIMSKDTGIYSYIIQKTRDIFNKDYGKLKFSPRVSSEFTIKSVTGTGVCMSMYSTQLKNGKFSADINFDLHRDPNVSTTFIVDGRDIVPGLNAVCSFNILKPRSDMIGLQYRHDCAGINVHLTGLTGNPNLNFSGFVRAKTTSLGTDVSYDIRRGKCTSAITVCYAGLTNTFRFNSKGSTLRASYCYKVFSNHWKNMSIIQRALASLSVVAVSAVARHDLLNRQNTITVSTQFALSCATMLKAHYNNYGVGTVVMRSMVTQNTCVTISSKVYTRSANWTPTIGVGFSTKF